MRALRPLLFVLLYGVPVFSQNFIPIPSRGDRYAARGGFQIGIAQLDTPDGPLTAPVLGNTSFVIYRPVFEGWETGWFTTETRPMFEGGVENESWRVTPIFDEPVLRDYRGEERELSSTIEEFVFGEIRLQLENLNDENDVRVLRFADPNVTAWEVDVVAYSYEDDGYFSMSYSSWPGPGDADVVELLPLDNDGEFNLTLASFRGGGNFVATLPGDATNDGAITFDDFLVLSSNFGQNEDDLWEHGNFDHDLDVDLDDFRLMAKNFGIDYCQPDPNPFLTPRLCNWDTAHSTLVTELPPNPATATVPEPGTHMLVFLTFGWSMLTIRRFTS